ncbi:lipopolysaccharide assembly protein LapB [Marinoscillum sp. MHG1-6]|uniref:tetratricopeptide repeat protein n=1 Tax=Marinoscillum sp. MHG1-6 TaxID=2959627 RepID=UPI0021572CF0|nr:hypothetical protein [Marinoscillum sp. MHG1-6]
MRILFLPLLCLSIFHIALSEKLDENNLEISTVAIYEAFKESPDSSISMAKDLELLAKKSGDKHYEFKSEYLQGVLLHRSKKMGEAFLMYLSTLEKMSDYSKTDIEDQKLYVNLLVNISIILREHQEYGLAIQYIKEALEYTEEHDLQMLRWTVYYNMAKHIAAEGRNYEDAIRYLDSAMSAAKLIDNTEMYLNAQNEQGLVLTDLQKFEKARSIFLCNLNYENTDHPSFNFYYRLALHNIADTYIQSENFVDAETYLVKASKFSTIPRLEYLTLMDLCEVYLELGDLQKAESYGLLAQELYPQVSALPLNYKLFAHMASLYFKKGDHKKSYSYSKRHIAEGKQFLKTQKELIDIKNSYSMVKLAAGFLTDLEESQSNNYGFILSILAGLVTMTLFFGKVRNRLIRHSIF